jgi:hypothetical protein
VAVGKRIALPLMPEVQHVMRVGRDAYGPTYADPVTRRALIEDVGEPVVDENGTTRLSTSKLTFLEPIPIDLLDRFVLDGQETDVARREGLVREDGTTRYFSIVYVGRKRS